MFAPMSFSYSFLSSARQQLFKNLRLISNSSITRTSTTLKGKQNFHTTGSNLFTASSNQNEITQTKLDQWRHEFYQCPKNIFAQNVCSRSDPLEAAISRRTVEQTNHVFQHKVEFEGKPVCNQKSSGRCWLFAALNTIRLPFMKKFNLDEFEFSQSFLFFWDKIERCNYFLNNIVSTARRGEKVDGRLVSFLLLDPTCDGGQWDMFCNLVLKHGLMPKKCFPESFSCESSVRMNNILKSKLREYARVLREAADNGASDAELNEKINLQMGEVYKIVSICLGIPPETFTWEYYDKSKAYQSVGPISSIEFYSQHVKPVFDVTEKVCLVSDPRPTSRYNQTYTVDCLGNVVGGRPVLYNNQPAELLLKVVTDSLKSGQAVWFGCEVSKHFASKAGIEDMHIYDFKTAFDVELHSSFTKADRLLYGESAMTHAMVFTAVSTDQNGDATKLRVENSWGEDRGEKGYLVMTAEWFKEFGFEVVVDKQFVPEEAQQAFNTVAIVLPAWDPMGTLAQ